MKKHIIFLIVVFISCNKKVECEGKINPNNITIRIEKSNPILKEYDRYLIVTCNKEDIYEIKIKEDIGSGAKSYLYDNDNFFTLIDCDSSWYLINKKDGEVTLTGKFWMKVPPKNYIGTFMINSRKKKVDFVKEKNIQTKNIYIYGGG
ncbi:hypothetical protein C8C83_0894 [Flavobacterium sp. 90]|uniref:hypothetical protein n=1 Tax=unclassified Flavobacterium TaxID=196869 RepID=UPI000EAD0461|nr:MULTISPECIES: hypothetical protein [unclassified Flavobacterium]RKR09274.1 hypothetical protein C8C82_1194 [Flavobacterium sp. 81]TCK53057.1 hypothetical protein C8C83_0894 [Flavobacterium sp. 90]